MRRVMSSYVRSALTANISAATPATYGVAQLVPLCAA